MIELRSVIDISELTTEEIDGLIATANDIIENPLKYSEKCRNVLTLCKIGFPAYSTLFHHLSVTGLETAAVSLAAF